MSELDLDAAEAMCAAATPGPWEWRVNPTSRSFYLEGTPRTGNEFVMGFERWGMGSAQPTLRKWVDADCDGGGYHLLAKGVEFLKPIPGREHHASWAQTVDQPDAAFIAAARTLVPQLVARVRELDRRVERYRTAWQQRGDEISALGTTTPTTEEG